MNNITPDQSKAFLEALEALEISSNCTAGPMRDALAELGLIEPKELWERCRDAYRREVLVPQDGSESAAENERRMFTAVAEATCKGMLDPARVRETVSRLCAGEGGVSLVGLDVLEELGIK